MKSYKRKPLNREVVGVPQKSEPLDVSYKPCHDVAIFGRL